MLIALVEVSMCTDIMQNYSTIINRVDAIFHMQSALVEVSTRTDILQNSAIINRVDAIFYM